MALQLPVLVRGINNLSDARYCAGMGADGLIFTLDPTLPGAVDVATVRELAGWVSGVELIGEFGAMSSTAINAVAAQCGLDRVLIRSLASLGAHEPVAAPALLEVFQMSVLDGTYHAQLTASAEQVLSTGVQFIIATPAPRPQALPHYAAAARRYPLWLSGNANIAWLLQLVEQVQPAGLIIQGGEEIKPGLRDFTELEAIFEALETDD